MDVGNAGGGQWPSTHRSLLARILQPENSESWRNYDPLFQYYCRRGLQDAGRHDVVQDILFQLQRSIGAFVYDPQRGRFRGWLGTIASRAVGRYDGTLRRNANPLFRSRRESSRHSVSNIVNSRGLPGQHASLIPPIPNQPRFSINPLAATKSLDQIKNPRLPRGVTLTFIERAANLAGIIDLCGVQSVIEEILCPNLGFDYVKVLNE